jgi:hypothetical protein
MVLVYTCHLESTDVTVQMACPENIVMKVRIASYINNDTGVCVKMLKIVHLEPLAYYRCPGLDFKELHILSYPLNLLHVNSSSQVLGCTLDNTLKIGKGYNAYNHLLRCP